MAWDNDAAFHVAQHTINLRKYRNCSQAEIARRMGSSQSAIATIESGEHNITMATLTRLAGALKGRLKIAIEPEEFYIPRWPDWWKAPDLGRIGPMNLHRVVVRYVDGRSLMAAGFEGTTPGKGFLSAQAT